MGIMFIQCPSVTNVLLASPFTTRKDVMNRKEIVNSLDNVALWSSLFHGQHAPFLHDEMDSFGWDQPGVRKACWNLLQIILKNHSGAHTCASSAVMKLIFAKIVWGILNKR